jgi:uncharacterized protein (TIRG00374 family)
MSDKERAKRFKTILTVITIGAMVFLAYAVRAQLADTLRRLGDVNTFALLFMLPFEAANYYVQARLYHGLFRILGERFRLRSLYRLAIELNFVNTVFPSGGVSGFSYLSLRLRDESISTGKATLVQLMRFVLIFIAFQILLFVGLVALAIGGQANDMAILAAGSLATLLLIGTMLGAYIIGSKSRINSFFTLITRIINRIIHVVRPKHPETISIESVRNTFSDLHENYMHIRRNKSVLKRPLFFALLANLTEIATIYMVYVAFGQFVNPGAVIIAYAVANFAGLVSVLPGGVGIYEALMTGVLAAGGVPASVSLPITVMYRVLNMLIQLPPGYYFYQKALHATSSAEETTEAVKFE